MSKAKKLTRGQKAWITRKANKNKINQDHNEAFLNNIPYRIRLPPDTPKPIQNIGSTMTLLEQAINELIQRINSQTQRIKDMM